MLSTRIINQQLSSEACPLVAFLSQQIQRTLTNPERSGELVAECEEMVEKLKSTKTPIKILLSTFNIPDGIGDAMNLIGVYVLLQRLFANIPSVEIKAILYINMDKLDNFKRALPADDMNVDDICYFSDSQANANKDITVFTSPAKPKSFQMFDLYKEVAAKAPNLKLYCKCCDLFINLSTPMVPETQPFDLLPKKCMVHSILETGHTLNLILSDTESVRKMRSYREVSMGLYKYDVGFRLDAKLVEVALSSDKLNRELALFKSTVLGKLIYQDDKQPRLAIGYLQSVAATHFSTEVFIRTGDQSKNIVLICNIELLNQYLEQNPAIKSNFSVIESANSDGKVLCKEVVNPRASRTLLVVDFRGIKEDAKRALTCVADWVMGSGDNSRAETLLARLPFWQILQWKITDVSDFIVQIERNYPAVANYLFLQLKAAAWDYELFEQSMVDDLVQYVNSNERALVNEWGQLRKQILQKHNLDHYLSSMLLSALGASIKPDSNAAKLPLYIKAIDGKYDALASHKYSVSPSTELFFNSLSGRLRKYLTIFMAMLAKDAAIEGLEKGLFKIFPYFDVGSPYFATGNNDKPLLFEVIRLNAVKCLALILKRQPDLNVNYSDTYNDLTTPLHLAVQMGHAECIKLLLAVNSIDTSLQDDSDKTAEDYAKTTKIKALFNNLPLKKYGKH